MIFFKLKKIIFIEVIHFNFNLKVEKKINFWIKIKMSNFYEK